MATLSDAQVVEVLGTAVSIINPVLDALATRDPVRLKKLTYLEGVDDPSLARRGAELLGRLVNVSDWPGTKGWSSRSMKERADWWSSRIGTLNTVAVAYPSALGAWTRRLPMGSMLGFANQAMVAVAVAREYGVTDRLSHIELLGSVLCGRDLHDVDPDAGDETERTKKRSLIGAAWDVAQVLRGLSGEMERRPQAPRLIRLVGAIPLVGAPVMYLGERIALAEAVNRTKRWIVAHRAAIDTADAN